MNILWYGYTRYCIPLCFVSFSFANLSKVCMCLCLRACVCVDNVCRFHDEHRRKKERNTNNIGLDFVSRWRSIVVSYRIVSCTIWKCVLFCMFGLITQEIDSEFISCWRKQIHINYKTLDHEWGILICHPTCSINREYKRAIGEAWQWHAQENESTLKWLEVENEDEKPTKEREREELKEKKKNKLVNL